MTKQRQKSTLKTESNSTRPRSIAKKKKLNRYEKQKFPALNPKYQVANRRALIGDIDYLDQLNNKEKEWLNSYLSESVITNFNHRGKKLYKSKEKKRELYRENNRRNADMYNVLKQTGNLVYHGSLSNFGEKKDIEPVLSFNQNDMEDAYLTGITLSRSGIDPDTYDETKTVKKTKKVKVVNKRSKKRRRKKKLKKV